MVTLKNGRLVEETTASQHLLEVNNRNPSSLSGSKAIESPAHRCTIGPLLTNTKCPNRPTPLLFFQGGGDLLLLMAVLMKFKCRCAASAATCDVRPLLAVVAQFLDDVYTFPVCAELFWKRSVVPRPVAVSESYLQHEMRTFSMTWLHYCQSIGV